MDAESEIPQSFERLRSAAETLNRESDALTSSLRGIEQGLKSLGLGIEVRLEKPVFLEKAEVDGAGEMQLSYYLGYGKCVGKSHKEWGIFVYSPDVGDGTIWSVPEMPRQLRMAAANHVAVLLDLLAGEAEKAVKVAQRAKSAAEGAAKRMR